MKTRILICGLALASSALLRAAPLTESTFTDLIRTVEVLEQPTKSASPAKLNEVFKAPNLVRTGASSRAELTAPDQTLTRVGANTVFSFAPAGREINLEQGSVLFHSPSGRGGGTIRSGGASAAVSGTTLIVATTPVTNPGDKNGFKVILLEGKGRVTLANGRYRKLKAGQMIFVLPNHSDFGPLFTINLPRLVAGSALINGFSHELPSLPLIQAAILKQQASMNKGLLSDTGTPADNFVNHQQEPGNGFQAGPSGGDPNLYQIGVNFAPINNFNHGGPTFNTGPTLVTPPAPPPQPLPEFVSEGGVGSVSIIGFSFNSAASMSGVTLRLGGGLIAGGANNLVLTGNNNIAMGTLISGLQAGSMPLLPPPASGLSLTAIQHINFGTPTFPVLPFTGLGSAILTVHPSLPAR